VCIHADRNFSYRVKGKVALNTPTAQTRQKLNGLISSCNTSPKPDSYLLNPHKNERGKIEVFSHHPDKTKKSYGEQKVVSN
jgi:hypothetical protein